MAVIVEHRAGVVELVGRGHPPDIGRGGGQVGEIGEPSRKQVIDHDDAPAFGEQGIAEMRSQKSGAAGDHRALRAHAFLPFFRTGAGTPSGCEAARPTL